MSGGWPTATLGPVARARALAASIPSAAWAEGILDAPYDVTWRWVRDLEVSVPQFDSQVTRLQVIERRADDGAERLRIKAWSMGIGLPFDVRLEEGYCLMQARARLYLVVMAAEPHDDARKTRFFHVEAIPLPGAALMRRAIVRGVRADIANLTRLARQGFSDVVD